MRKKKLNKMQKESLILGQVYTCSLSKLEILITDITVVGKVVTNVRGTYYNPQSGLYVTTNINNNQLNSK